MNMVVNNLLWYIYNKNLKLIDVENRFTIDFVLSNTTEIVMSDALYNVSHHKFVRYFIVSKHYPWEVLISTF